MRGITRRRLQRGGDNLLDAVEEQNYETIRTGLFVGAACVLALIRASLLVSQLEQLRERRELLSALVAFGTRRRTLSLSVLWQTAIPVALALIVGLTLGGVLLRMTDTAIRVDWTSVLVMTGIGAAAVLAVTALSLPPLLRLMRPDGLRTEYPKPGGAENGGGPSGARGAARFLTGPKGCCRMPCPRRSATTFSALRRGGSGSGSAAGWGVARRA